MKEQERLENQFKEQQTKNIELLTFFSGLLALVLTIAGPIGGLTGFNQNMGLICVLGGVLILSFSVLMSIFDFIYLSKREFAKFMGVPIVVGLVLSAAGWFIGNFL